MDRTEEKYIYGWLKIFKVVFLSKSQFVPIESWVLSFCLFWNQNSFWAQVGTKNPFHIPVYTGIRSARNKVFILPKCFCSPDIVWAWFLLHMNHLKTCQTNLMAPGDPLDAPLDPLGPPGPPIDPQWPLNRSLGLIELLRSPHLLFKSSEEPSNVTVEPMGHLTHPPWPNGTL